MPYRLIALDLDGTTLAPDGQVRPRVVAAIEAAASRGVIVALATGRRLESARPIAHLLRVSYLILTDGTVIYDLARDRALREDCFTPELQRRAIDLIRAAGLPPVLFESPAAGSRVLVGPAELDNPETVEFVRRREGIIRLPLAELARVPRVVAILGMGDEAVVESLAARCDDASCYAMTFWRPTSAGYTRPTVALGPPGTSKGHALHWLADHLGIAPAETLAIGDHLNDISMLTMAGLGVAMGNALPEVKAAASAVVAGHAEDGVAEALERWVLRPGDGPARL